MESISIVVLAGGQSQRMGSNKALLRIDDRETLIERVVNNLKPLSDDIVLVSNAPELYADLPVRQTADLFPGAGPLAGLHAGLQTARHPWSLVVACDMPLVDHRLVRFMILLTQGHDLVVPRWNRGVRTAARLGAPSLSSGDRGPSQGRAAPNHFFLSRGAGPGSRAE